jgi:hypothetical protein
MSEEIVDASGVLAGTRKRRARCRHGPRQLG